MKFVKVFYMKWTSPMVRQPLTKHLFWGGENCNKVAETVIWGHTRSQWQQFDAEWNRDKFTEWEGLSLWRSQDRKESIHQEWKQFEKKCFCSLILLITKVSISILKSIFKWLTRSWSTFDSSWRYRIISKIISFIMCVVSFSKGQRIFLDKNRFQKRIETVIIEFSSCPPTKFFHKVIRTLASMHSEFYLP